MAFTREQQEILNRVDARLEARGIGEYGTSPQSRQPAESQRLRSAAQGLTFGYADEIEAYIRSLGQQGESYEAVRDDIRRRLRAYQEQNPMASIGYETIGAIAPTALSLLSGVGAGAGLANVGRLARTGTNIVPTAATLGGRVPRIARGAALGATYGGLYGTGTAEGDLQDRLEQAKDFAGTGALFGVGTQAIGGVAKLGKSLVGRFSKANNTQDIIDIQGKLQTHRENVYKQLDNSPNSINSSQLQNSYQKLLQDAQETFNYQANLPRESSSLQNLTTDGFQDMLSIIRRGAQKDIPQELSDNLTKIRTRMNRLNNQGVSEKNLAELSKLQLEEQSLLQQIDNIPEKGISIRDLQNLQQRLNKLYTSSRSSSNVEQPMLRRMSDEIDNIVSNMGDDSDIWTTAKSLWRAEKNIERIQNAFDKAQRQVQAGVNVDEASYYKRMANNILNSNDINYFTPEEQQLFRNFVEGNFFDNLLRQFGTYAPSSGNFMRLMAIGGAFYSNGATVPFTILSQLAKTTSNNRTRENANNIIREMIKNAKSGDKNLLEEIGLSMQDPDIQRIINTGNIPSNISQRIVGPTVGAMQGEDTQTGGFTQEQLEILSTVNRRLQQQ